MSYFGGWCTNAIRVGDRILIAGWPPHALEVIDTTDPALLVVIGPTGREFKVGRSTVAAILTKEQQAADSARMVTHG